MRAGSVHTGQHHKGLLQKKRLHLKDSLYGADQAVGSGEAWLGDNIPLHDGFQFQLGAHWGLYHHALSQAAGRQPAAWHISARSAANNRALPDPVNVRSTRPVSVPSPEALKGAKHRAFSCRTAARGAIDTATSAGTHSR